MNPDDCRELQNSTSVSLGKKSPPLLSNIIDRSNFLFFFYLWVESLWLTTYPFNNKNISHHFFFLVYPTRRPPLILPFRELCCSCSYMLPINRWNSHQSANVSQLFQFPFYFFIFFFHFLYIQRGTSWKTQKGEIVCPSWTHDNNFNR